MKTLTRRPKQSY